MTQFHKYYVTACLEKRVSFRVLSLLADDWIDQIRASGCDGFLVWPSCLPTSAKQAFDYRLYFLESELGAKIFPSWQECWLTEHKPRLRDWLVIHDIPHPRTWVFHDRSSALEFARQAEYPIVVKTATGASGSGVTIVRRQAELERLIHLAFGRGLRPSSFSTWDRQRGFIFLQQYYPGVQEWRMVRMGDYYFGHQKGVASSGKHSGSGVAIWGDPGRELLEFTRRVTEAGNFCSMDVDVFRTQQGELLVNECQTVFGCSIATTQMRIDQRPCYYRYEDGSWVLHDGDICQNHMCNLRVDLLLEQLRQQCLS